MIMLRVQDTESRQRKGDFLCSFRTNIRFLRLYGTSASNAHGIIAHFNPNFYILWKIFCIRNCKLFVNKQNWDKKSLTDGVQWYII